MSIDSAINETLAPISHVVSETIFFTTTILGHDVPLILLWLVTAGLIFTVYLRAINITGFAQAIRIVRGVYENPKSKGQVSHFQALTAALSATVGLGNIAGVAIAISLGGPGAMVWMILAALFGMTTKFTECTLGVKYRDIHKDGHVIGGPMMYLTKGLAKRGMPMLGKILATLFCVFTILGCMGASSLFQTNQAYIQFVSITGGDGTFIGQNGWLFGLVMAGFVGVVIMGGITSIARVTEKLVPFMCGLYVLGAIIVLVLEAGKIPGAFAIIFDSAFNGDAAFGGVVGAMIQGFRRAAFSNEAGLGSAAIAHSAVKTDEPVDEGYVALLEPFIDTVVVCTMTALVIIITGSYQNVAGEISGVSLTSDAFASVLPWFPYVLGVCVILFAYSTIITWTYYASQSADYLSGHSKTVENIVKILILVFVMFGASASLDEVIHISDGMIFAMAIPNIIGLYLLAPDVKAELANYQKKLKAGKIKRYK